MREAPLASGSMVESRSGVARTRFGGWVTTTSPELVEEMAWAGFDFVCLDLQHGAFDLGTAIQSLLLLDASGVRKLVRFACSELSLAPRLLDYGADGIVVASLETAEQAQASVAAARYPPDGVRSFGGSRTRRIVGDRRPDEIRPEVVVMIETARALEEVDEIAGVAGLTGLFIGTTDLGLSLGLGPAADIGDKTFGRAIDRIVQAACRNRIEVLVMARDGMDAERWSSRGVDRVVVGSDLTLLRAALARELARARGVPESPA